MNGISYLTKSQCGGYSECINMLRFPLAILVVFVHGFGPDIDLDKLHASGFTGIAIYDYVRLFFSSVLASCAVPLFFMFSGFLFFNKVGRFDSKEYLLKMHTRIRTLLVPYILWIVLMILWTLLLKVGGVMLHGKPWSGILAFFETNGWWHLFWDCNVWGESKNWMGILTHSSGPYLLPFWYMRDLIVMVILSPVIYFLIKKMRCFFLILLVALYALDIKVSFISGSFNIAILFFSVGAYWGILKKDFAYSIWKYRYLVSIIAIFLIICQTYMGVSNAVLSKFIYPWMVIFESLFVISLASSLSHNYYLFSLNKRLASTSFFIYAFHPFILVYIIKILRFIVPNVNSFMMIISYLCAPLTCVVVCVGCYWAFNKWMPNLLGIFIGKRKCRID